MSEEGQMVAAESKGEWDVHALMEPEILLPGQLSESHPADRNGEFGLLWAVFIDGVQTYCKGVMRGATSSLTHREVERWIFRPSSDAITSFSNLCELFAIDPRRLRRALLRFREQPSAELMEFLTQNAA
jgi:hypothetical protein